MIIGLTGGVACGKSSAVTYFIKYGARVINADKISKEVSESKKVIAMVAEQFGKECIKGDGIDRKKLAKIVFEDKEKLELFENITKKLSQRVENLKIIDCDDISSQYLDENISIQDIFLNIDKHIFEYILK